MYELEYLYEQLKTQIIEYNYITQLDSISESSYDIVSANDAILETMNAIQEASNKSRLKLVDKMRLKFADADKILSTYKDKALNTNPIGLQYEDFITFKSDSDIKKLYKKAIDYLNSFDPQKASEQQCADYIKDSQHNVQYMQLSKIFGEGKERYSLKDIVVSKKSDKELKKSDISDAVKYVKEYDKKIKDLNDEIKRQDEAYTKYVRDDGFAAIANMNKTSGDLSSLRKNATNHKLSLRNIADSTYLQMLSTKYNKEFAQTKKIIIKAANYNPRNLKESYMKQDYIDSMHDFLEVTENI